MRACVSVCPLIDLPSNAISTIFPLVVRHMADAQRSRWRQSNFSKGIYRLCARLTETKSGHTMYESAQVFIVSSLSCPVVVPQSSIGISRSSQLKACVKSSLINGIDEHFPSNGILKHVILHSATSWPRINYRYYSGVRCRRPFHSISNLWTKKKTKKLTNCKRTRAKMSRRYNGAA